MAAAYLSVRCVCADVDTAEGSAWQYSSSGEWTLLDADISNTNGPTVAVLDDVLTLIIGDSSAHYYRYDYEPSSGSVGTRSVFGDMSGLRPDGSNGVPDGSTLDIEGGLWCALPRSSCLVRFTTSGLAGRIDLPFEYPTDVTFGGPNLDRLYVVGINEGLYVLDGIGTGRVEPRFGG
jgi:L-arabinonolactonase